MGRRSVLVVDDEPRRQEILRQFLERQGYQTEGAHDGERALEKARSFEPDLVLTNREMPDLQGEDLAARILEVGVKTRLILMVDRCSRAATTAFCLAGGAVVLVKPFGLRDLLAHVRAALGDDHKINQHLAAERRRNRGAT